MSKALAELLGELRANSARGEAARGRVIAAREAADEAERVERAEEKAHREGFREALDEVEAWLRAEARGALDVLAEAR